MPFLKRSSSPHMNISLPIMDANELFPFPSTATSSWNNLSRPFSIMAYSNDLSDELLSESPAAISKYLTNTSNHSSNSSKLIRHNYDHKKTLSGLKKHSQLTKRASMQLDEHKLNNHNQTMTSSVSSFNISSSYLKSSSSTVSLRLETPPKLEINIDHSSFDDFYASTTASLSEAADANPEIVRVISNATDKTDTTEAFGLVSPAPSTETFESAGYTIYDDHCTQYSTPSSSIADSSSISFKSCGITDSTVATSPSATSQKPLSTNTNDCTSMNNEDHKTTNLINIKLPVPAVSFLGTLWVGGNENEDSPTKSFIHEPGLFSEYDDDDDDDLEHLVCYTKLRPRMASFVR